MVTFENARCRQIIDISQERKTSWSWRKWQVVLFRSHEAGEDIKRHDTKGEDEIIGGKYCHDEAIPRNHYGLKSVMRKRRNIRREGERKSLVLIGSSHPSFAHKANVIPQMDWSTHTAARGRSLISGKQVLQIKAGCRCSGRLDARPDSQTGRNVGAFNQPLTSQHMLVTHRV